MAKSIEEIIEDLGKKQLGSTKYFTKTESINAKKFISSKEKDERRIR